MRLTSTGHGLFKPHQGGKQEDVADMMGRAWQWVIPHSLIPPRDANLLPVRPLHMSRLLFLSMLTTVALVSSYSSSKCILSNSDLLCASCLVFYVNCLWVQAYCDPAMYNRLWKAHLHLCYFSSTDHKFSACQCFLKINMSNQWNLKKS